ncbi:MAG: NUDIX hydrolase [Planctomycetaceae bacterium]
MASVVAVIRNKHSQILFVQRSPLASRGSQWALPGGKIKSHEVPAQAIVREVAEETNLAIRPLCELVDFGDQAYWLCEVTDDRPVYLNERECAAFSWSDPQRILELGMVMDLKRLREVLEKLNLDIGDQSRGAEFDRL